MKVTDVQEDAVVNEYCSACACDGLLFGFFALIKLDLPIDENVHLNVNTHISGPAVKYGGFAGII